MTCGGRHLQGVLGKWVLAQTGRIPNFRPASPQALSAEGVVFRLWVIGFLLHDRIYCDATKGGRTLRLDDVPNKSSPCHHHWGAVDAVSCGGRQQHRGGVASHCCLSQRDW